MAERAGRSAFPKGRRLLRRAQYLLVKERGAGFAEGPLAASWLPRKPGEASDATRRKPESAGVRVGITVSSKVGGSVERNRVKRKIREAVRHELAALPAVDLVLVARGSALNASVETFRGWIRRAARRIERGLV